jgi:hypothetical protein
MIVQLVLWFFVGLLLGVAAYMIAPWAIVMNMSRGKRQKVTDWYISQATSAGQRLGLVNRQHAGATVTKTSWDPKRRAEKFCLDGEDEYVGDPANMMADLSGRPFGILSEAYDAVVEPWHLHVAERWREALHEDSDLWEVESEDGETVTLVQTAFDLKDRVKIVDLNALDVLQAGGADPRDREHAYENAKKSQEGFSSNVRLRDVAYMGTAFALTAGVTWFVSSYGGQVSGAVSGGGGGVSVPMLRVVEVMTWAF